jgi:thioredoxin 1
MTLKEILKTDKTVLIDFFSDDCPPCLMVTDVLGKIHDQIENECEIYTIDREKHPEVFEIFEVKSLPHLKLFKKGKPVWSGSGLFNEEEIKQLLEEYI